jgi:tyrosyl-tRNA synthetase
MHKKLLPRQEAIADLSPLPVNTLAVIMSVASDLQLLQNATDTVISPEELDRKLALGRPLRVKLGLDPTRPDLTLGHAVVFQKLRQFQDLGHEAHLVIGDFTATIGDPSGRSALRPQLTREEVEANATTYLEQAFRVIDKSKTVIHRNSSWFDRMSFEDVLILTRKMTVARMLERDDFSKRYQANTPISIVEFLYPLVQGHDSVMLVSDVELGGRDQLFNMLVGRQLQKDAGQEEQVVICMPLLVGTDGTQKMSKSLDNYIAFNDPPKEMFGKVMSIGDDLMWSYFTLLLGKSPEEIAAMKKEHPMEMKKSLAESLTARFHSPEDGRHERAVFEQVFSRHETPDEMPEVTWSSVHSGAGEPTLLDALNASGLLPSKKEARRLIQQGAVKIDGEKINTPEYPLPAPSRPCVIQAGKRRFFRLIP